MIYSILQGRLGNLFFEIAAGASLAKKMGVPYKVLTCNSELKPNHYLIDCISKYQKSILRRIDFLDRYPEDSTLYCETSFTYKALPLQNNLVLNGYFQSEKYFDKDLVRYLFEIDPETEAYLQEKYGHILKLNSVSIHVRRGDYLKLEYKHPVCRMPYFNKAMACFQPGTNFLVFSDDMVWCKKHFKGDRFYFVEGEQPLTDLYLQSMCSHHIISNSTFSWWGAWLNSNPDKKVIYPDPWFGFIVRNKKEFDTSDLCPDNWIPMPLGERIPILRRYYLYLKFIISDTILYRMLGKLIRDCFKQQKYNQSKKNHAKTNFRRNSRHRFAGASAGL